MKRTLVCLLLVCCLTPCIPALARGESAKEYALLYSMTGYAANGTKRAFLRQLTAAPATVPDAWRLYWIGDMEELAALRTACEGLLDEAYRDWLTALNGETALEGTFSQEPETFQVTVYAGDFSRVSRAGAYVLTASLRDGKTLLSKPFVITASPLSDAILPALSVYNAQARFAKHTIFGGYYDCNNRFGEAYSHGTYLSGLSNYYLHGGADLDADTQAQLLWAAQAAFDYLMRLHTEKTGEIRYSPAERPGDAAHNSGIHNSIEAVCGLAAYMDAFSMVDSQRVTEENRRKLLATIDYIEGQIGANMGYHASEWKTSALCHLYNAFRIEDDLAAARASAEVTLRHFDWE